MNYDFYFYFYIIQHIITINIVIYVGIVIFYHLKIDALLALYNLFDPFFYFFQFISYMFIHSIHSFLHITFNMLVLWTLGLHINKVFGTLNFISIYFSSGVIAGLLQNMLKFLMIYHYTGIFNLYKISHGFIYVCKIQRIYLQYSMYSPIIGSSGAISSMIGPLIPRNFYFSSKIFIPNYILYKILVILNIFTGISHLFHLSGAIAGYYISQIMIEI